MIRFTRSLLLLTAVLYCANTLNAQTITGTVSDLSGNPLSGVNIFEKGTTNGTVSTAEGQFSIRLLNSTTAVLVFSSVGFVTLEIRVSDNTNWSVVLKSGVQLNPLTIVGSRSLERTTVDSPVPIDVVDMRATAVRTGQSDFSQLLHTIAPSFNANRQSGADGSDHTDPATLRGLGPDQTLVLVNGKRRHPSSLVNIYGSRGRGNAGTDLNAIPLSAIARVEILRDGAAAQYGSDAIAGVLNIVLKEHYDQFEASLHNGVYFKGDGLTNQISAAYGVQLNDRGFVSLTGDFQRREKTFRENSDPDAYRKQFGDGSANDASLWLNSSVDLGNSTRVYAFGGLSIRKSDAYAWTRNADSDRNIPAIYPNGFDPRIAADIMDRSISVGLKGTISNWSWDAYQILGSNQFDYNVRNTLNASLLQNSPTTFDAGGFRSSQITSGVDMSRRFGWLKGLNVAFGAEHRFEGYSITAGEEGSWRNYMPDGDAESRPGEVIIRPGGSQGFPGFRPENELDASRRNLGAYIDLELNATTDFLVTGALRTESYSDFGEKVSGKLATRIKVNPHVSFRASAGSGFRAPSLPQMYFNSIFTDFISGRAVDQLLARNDSEIASLLGIPRLSEESSYNIGMGLSLTPTDGLTVTADYYHVQVDDRVVLTGLFEADVNTNWGQQLVAMNVSGVQFFTNAISTTTNGLDIVADYHANRNGSQWGLTLAGNVNSMKLGAINTSALLEGEEETYFGEREKAFLLASAPPVKWSLSTNFSRSKWSGSLKGTLYGTIELIDWVGQIDRYAPRVVFDAHAGYQLTPQVGIHIGAANLFNTYPTRQDIETETGGMWDAVQMGSNGGFLFGKIVVRM